MHTIHLRKVKGLAYAGFLGLLCLLGGAAGTALAAAEDSASSLRVEPAEFTLHGNLARLQIQVTGRSPDGRETDLTRQVQYDNLNPQIVAVDEQGRVRPLAEGTARIRVHHDKDAAELTLHVEGVNLAQPAASFREDVIPILAKAGCSQGACHASQHGKGGLKLSLFGYAPEQDYPQLVRDWLQRRISPMQPDDSLILRKATMQVGHGGGKRFNEDSYEYRVLRDWVAAGAPPLVKDEPHIVDLTVTPYERVYRKGEQQQLRVVAHYSDGTSRDVTARALFDSLGDGVAQVDRDGYVTIVGPGQAAIMVRYQGQAKVSHILSPFRDKVDLAGFQPKNFVDEAIKVQWERLGLEPSPPASDAEFIRRAFLDALGTLPEPERVEAFLASSDPSKRDQLVAELLGLTGDPKRDIYVDEWSAYWTLKWGDLLRINRNSVGDGGMWAFHNWIRQSLRENKPIDQFVREIITAQGSIYENGPANFFKIDRRPTDLAETTAQVFLGVRIQCARCHHHPFEVYSQADYYGMAAFFTRVGTKSSTEFGALGADTVVKVNDSGSIRHPRTGRVMQPTPLLEEPIDAGQYRDLRRALAEWITSPENELFARNIVNRFWAYFMGTGLVEPVDDMRATNPPSNPELLDALAEDFVASGFDLRHLMQTIMTSQVYQLSSTPRPENAPYNRFYTHYNVKRLPAEVLLDAIDFACGTQERFRGVPAGTRAIELPDPNYASYFLDTLGRPPRVVACECERTSQPNLAQVLHLANGEVLNRKLTDANGRIARLVKEQPDDEAAFRELYLVTVSRPPTPEEIAACRQIVAKAPNRREGLEDVLWALCNSREFLFNH